MAECSRITEIALLSATLEQDLIIKDAQLAERIRSYLDEPSPKNALDIPAVLEIQVHFPADLVLSVLLPETYPDLAKPHATLSGGTLPRAQLSILKARIPEFLNDNAASEPLLAELVAFVRSEIDDMLLHESQDLRSDAAEGEGVTTDSDQIPAVSFTRILFFAHHLLSVTKRKDIQRLSRDLQLFTFSRRGYPGLIAAEGLAENIEEFIKCIKGMRWAQINLRYEEKFDLIQGESWTSKAILKTTFQETDNLHDFAMALQADPAMMDSVIN